MQISELMFTVDKHGGMKIPAFIMEKMGLAPGDHVRVAYLTQDGTANTFREFMLLPAGIGESDLDEDSTIRIPVQLMQQAGISSDADLQIACLNGALVICQDTGIQPEELYSVLESLETAESLATVMSGDTQQILLQLAQAINTIQEGAEENG